MTATQTRSRRSAAALTAGREADLWLDRVRATLALAMASCLADLAVEGASAEETLERLAAQQALHDDTLAMAEAWVADMKALMRAGTLH